MLPFLKWAGGKRWLFDKKFIASLPPFERYVEPFLGGGAGFFALRPANALLSDLNLDLIELYASVRDNPAELELALNYHQAMHSKAHYYSVREYVPSDRLARAARTLYLNRTCWNGLYRLNRRGEFNVPIGTKTAVILPTDDFLEASTVLQKATLQANDFETTIDLTKHGDLLFVDPPYTTKHDMNGFVKYNERIFAWSDQVRLRAALGRAKDRGACLVITNANHQSLHELYEGFGCHCKIDRQSIISGKTAGRSAVSELMVRV